LGPRHAVQMEEEEEEELLVRQRRQPGVPQCLLVFGFFAGVAVSPVAVAASARQAAATTNRRSKGDNGRREVMMAVLWDGLVRLW
jgi:hypothetical protein